MADVGRPIHFGALERQYWSFHWGRPPSRRLVVRGPMRAPNGVAQLGHLAWLELASGAELHPGGGKIHLATDERGRDLYLVSRDGVVLPRSASRGAICAIAYRTNKGDGSHVWRHEFEPPRPYLAVDRDGLAVIQRRGSRYAIHWTGIVR